ncbi:MAG: hypothetical protein V4665_01460 [Patescibacteria group bacterium]
MESILKSDIFFFITSISVCIITVGLIVGFYYLIKIMKNIADISETVKKSVHAAESEIEELAERVSDSTVFRMFFGRKKKKKKEVR